MRNSQPSFQHTLTNLIYQTHEGATKEAVLTSNGEKCASNAHAGVVEWWSKPWIKRAGFVRRVVGVG